MPLDDFYSFICDDYYLWKFGRRFLSERQKKFCDYYVENKNLDELLLIQQELFSFDLTNVKLGFEIATKIKGLRTIGASGLLSILFPRNFGTIDQFAIKSLLKILNLPQYNVIEKISMDSPTIDDGVFLIRIMKDKADELNKIFNTRKWTPRNIDKVLWAFRD